MSNYSIQTDPNLHYYVYFEHQGQQGDNVHRDSDNNVYDFSDNLGYRETFLLMPAGQANDVNFYYIFTTNGAGNDCWTIGDNDNGTLLHDHVFNGDDSQKFFFTPVGDGSDNVYILNKRSGKSLYRSTDRYHTNGKFYSVVIRQSDGRDSSHQFALRQRTDMPVFIPQIQPANVTSQDQLDQLNQSLYKTSLLGLPPSPPCYNGTPAFPAKVFIGETLLPFYQISEDPASTGDLRDWQVGNRPYYRYRREQQLQFFTSGYYSVPNNSQLTRSFEYQGGIQTTHEESLETKTGFALEFTKETTATIGLGDEASAEASKGMSAQWYKETVMSVTDTVTKTQSVTVSVEYTMPQVSYDATYIQWVACDIYTLYYDDFAKNVNSDAGASRWINASNMTYITSYPGEAPMPVKGNTTYSDPVDPFA